MRSVVLSGAGAIVTVLAFPPHGPGWLVLVGVTLFLIAIRLAESRRQGLWLGAVYGLIFFGWLMWWLVELEVIALILVPVQAGFLAAYGWWLAGYNDRDPGVWLTLAVGGWGFMELIRYYFPVGGLEWGAVGYALSDNGVTRAPAALIGTAGLTLLVVLVAALVAQAATKSSGLATYAGAGAVMGVLVLTFVWVSAGSEDDFAVESAVVQGSTPCPFTHCPPNERLRTFEQHLTLTQTIPSNLGGLVVWSEGSTGSTNADPVQNPEIGTAIGDQAARLDSWMVVGSDRPLDNETWVNANVFFDPSGEIVGEYHKQHPVPFGEYIPLRPLFDWIPALDRVPRDMIPGDGPFVVDTGFVQLGSVISFEGGFSRYALETRRAGADVIVVATNEASYGPDAPTSDQFIGMTRMRAVELGVPVVHAAVTGKSVFIDQFGSLGPTTGLGTQEVLEGGVGDSRATPYTTLGDSILYLAALSAVAMWLRIRWLVGSGSMRSRSSSMQSNSAMESRSSSMQSNPQSTTQTIQEEE